VLLQDNFEKKNRWVYRYVDEYGNMKSNASDDLQKIRINLLKKKWTKKNFFGVAKSQQPRYEKDIEESFSNGSRYVAAFFFFYASAS